MSQETFLWHDYETFGADPRRDRPCQFAALRTDHALEPIEQPVVLYAQPTADVLPHPDACLITGITPQLAEQHGLPEYEFAARINALMSKPGTCTVGYNNFRFDDEVTRFLFWRNFLDPYAREFRNGNSRFDLIDVLRLTRALRPDGIEWPEQDDGAPSFRLEALAQANRLPIEHAHDALADVENTLSMARLVRQNQPRLWDWCLGLRARHRVEQMLDSGDMLLHASARIPAREFCIAPVVALFRHPIIKTQWLVWNLRASCEPFEGLDSEELADRHWTATVDLPEDVERLPVKWVRSNRCPMLAPTAVLSREAARRTDIDLERAKSIADRLRQQPGLISRLRQVLGERAPESGASADPDAALYQGFVSNPDRLLCQRIADQTPEQTGHWLAEHGVAGFNDARLESLLIHYIGRHAEHTLNPEQRARWHTHLRRRLRDDPELASVQLPEFHRRVATLRRAHDDRAELFDALEHWGRQAERVVLAAEQNPNALDDAK